MKGQDKTVRQYLIDCYNEKEHERDARIEKIRCEENAKISDKERRKQFKKDTEYPTPWHIQVGSQTYHHWTALCLVHFTFI